MKTAMHAILGEGRSEEKGTATFPAETTGSDHGRYAIYFAPGKDSALDLFGRQWVGRCAETGRSLEQPDIPVMSREALRAMTRSPRHYGFHATLAPPFRLKPGLECNDLVSHARAFASDYNPFDLGPLSVREIGSFLALVPGGQKAVARLASKCVKSFYPLREQPTLAEMERRKARGLTPAQERLLVRWGYPYVHDEFRFHLTLSDSIKDKGLRRSLMQALDEITLPLRQMTHRVDEICIFHQEDAASPFLLIQRIQLGIQQDTA